MNLSNVCVQSKAHPEDTCVMQSGLCHMEGCAQCQAYLLSQSSPAVIAHKGGHLTSIASCDDSLLTARKATHLARLAEFGWTDQQSEHLTPSPELPPVAT